MTSLQQQVVEEFTRRYGTAPTLVVRAPGRVNLIGEHTDYNDGYVMPLAIDRAVWIAARPRGDSYVTLYSMDFQQAAELSLTEIVKRENLWVEYVQGVAWALQEAGHSLAGWNGVIAGDVPIGAGLSSSAAIELASARAFCSIGNVEWNAPEMAKLCQHVENDWIGVKTGIMDQMISATGVKDHAVLIDCRWLHLDPVPLPPGTVVVVLDTATRRELVTSEYGKRRAQCEAAARFLNVPALRDVTMEQLVAVQDLLDDVIFRRARHVVGENERTMNAAYAMRNGDAATLGRLMNESHASLRDDYEVSSDALNLIVECARAHEACIGARMTGGGFGGCAVALVKAEAAQDFAEKVAATYQQKSGRTPAIYVCQATDGASIVSE
ncbi:MAG TPA: galactokinase [Phototrophicaceae bacterium]|nr:galactokinase [Phototrophicaceae bacterium]